MAMVHEMIGLAMKKIGAIGKDSKNTQQGFMYRGIDAVYNALNPVMSELGLFICPEIIDQKREERTTKNGTAITYTILTIKYTVYAPDGSNITLTVVGEGMDSGDKSSNKAMSVAMKYAMFQLFFIPTEELKDPDADVYEVAPRKKETPHDPYVSSPVAIKVVKPVTVEKVERVPALQKKVDEAKELTPAMKYLLESMGNMREARQITAAENNKLFKTQRDVLVKAKLAPDKKLEEYTMDEAVALVDAMYKCFTPTGTELKTE